MKQFKSIMLGLFLFTTFIINAQEADCAMSDSLVLTPNPTYSASIDPDVLEAFAPAVFNIFFWGIHDDNGNSTIPFTEEKALTAVAQLNIVYSEFNIFFKYHGYDIINSTTFNIMSDNPGDDSYYENLFTEFLVDNPDKKRTDSFNAYVPYDSAGGGVAEALNKVNFIINIQSLIANSGTLQHEVGHCLGLVHTHNAWTDNYCERVTRDANNTGIYNANTQGDAVPDTSAVPDFLFEHLIELLEMGVPFPEAWATFERHKYIDEITHVYNNPNGDDCQGTPYEISTIDTKNYMAYGRPLLPDVYAKNFTVGQKIRMHESVLIDSESEFGPAKNAIGIASLYQPYAGFYAPYFPYIGNEPPLFQPGLTYRFVECECECPQPTPYGSSDFTYSNNILLTVSPFETDYSSIAHPNHSAIQIAEIPVASGSSTLTTNCWDNWVTPPVIGGSVTLFHDGVFNANVTITPQDSIQINDSNLIPNLDNGLYNIKKTKADGSIEETNILKGN